MHEWRGVVGDGCGPEVGELGKSLGGLGEGDWLPRCADDVGACLGVLEVGDAPFTPGGACCEEAQGCEEHEEGKSSPERACGTPTVALGEVGFGSGGEFEQFGIAALQVGDDATGDDEFGKASEGEVPDHHGGDGDVEWVEGVERCASGVGEEQRLDAKFDGGEECGDVDGGVTGDGGGDDAAWGFEGCASSDEAIGAMGDE